MSLSVQDLLSIQKMPDVEDLTLQTISMFYEEHLCNRQFVYQLKHKQQELRLRFKEGDLCHLLGVQYVIKNSQHSGEPGFRKLKDGTITFDSLAQANLGGYEYALYRMLYFPFVYQLIHNPTLVVNHPHEKNRVNAQFTFYNKYTNRFVELKLRRENEENPNFFLPVSFVELRKIEPRKYVDVNSMHIVDYHDGYHGT